MLKRAARAARAARVALLAALCITGLSVPAHGATGPTGYLTMTGTGTYVVGTASLLWRNSEIAVSGSLDSGIQIVGSGGSSGKSYDLELAAAPGQSLAVGQYDDAQRTSFREAGHPGIDLSGEGRGCNTVAGSFTVKDIAADLSKVWITYKHYCEGLGGAPIFGEIKIGEPEDPQLLVAPQTIDWPDVPGKGTSTAPVNLFNISPSTINVSSASITSGSEAFKVASNSCTALAPGATCAVGVTFNPQTVAHFAGTLTITDSSTAGTHAVALSGTSVPAPVKATITTAKSPFPYGATAPITVTMGGTWTNPSLSIYRKVVGVPTELIETTGVGADGKVTVPVVVRQNATFTVNWTDGAQSGTATKQITVTPFKVVLSTPHTTIKYPGKAHLDIALRGSSPSHKVKIYKKVGAHARVLYTTRYVSSSTGKTSLDISVSEKTTISVDWTDGFTAASSSKSFFVAPKIAVAAHGYYGKSGSTYLYRPGSKIYLSGTVYPSRPGACVAIGIEVWTGSFWSGYASTGCVHLSSKSTGLGYLTYSSDLRGRKLRGSVYFIGDSRNIKSRSPYVYLTYR